MNIIVIVVFVFNFIGKHTIFGRIHSGMKVIQRIGSIATNTQDKPLDDIRIIKAKLSNNNLLMM